MKFLALMLLLVGPCARGDDETTPCTVKDFDKYLDEILEKMRKGIPEPMRLPPRSTFVDLDEGRVWGLRDVKRYGPVTVTCNEDGSATHSAKLGVEELKVRYNWEKENGKNGVIVGISDNATANIKVEISKNSDEHPKVVDFAMDKLHDIRVEMTGMRYLTWLLSEMVTALSGIFQRTLTKAIQGPMKEVVEREIREMKLSSTQWDCLNPC